MADKHQQPNRETKTNGYKPLSQDEFAKMLLKRIRASGNKSAIKYDAENFRLLWPGGHVEFLGYVYRSYLRLESAEREKLIQKLLIIWHTFSSPVPDDFDDVRADILPGLSPRSLMEIQLPRIEGENPPVQYEVVGEHLAVWPVHDRATLAQYIPYQHFVRWGVTFGEVMEVAKRNLANTPTQYKQLGPVHAFRRDAFDASRMVLLDVIRGLEVVGDHVAMVPNCERLFVTGSQDDQGLAIMAELAYSNIDLSGLAFRLEGDAWRPWMPPTSDELYPTFKQLQVQTLCDTYTEQAEMLNARFENDGTDIFVESYSRLENQNSSEYWSWCSWIEGFDALLPETDKIFLYRSTSDSQQGHLVASGDWDTVRRVTGEMMQPQGMYPERWRVREFPSEAMLREIGMPYGPRS